MTLLVVAALAWGLAVPAALATVLGGASSTTAVRFHDADGIHVVSVKQYDSRDYNVSVLSADLGRPVNVRILVPSDYSSAPNVRFPTLYLFHGTSGGASDWIDDGDAEPLTAGLPLIVVMPDAGFHDDGGGWFTNWVDKGTPLGPSQWESFHIDQLIPWVDANLRTIADRAGRAVAGLSQGGFGSMTYAAQYPDLFQSAAAFSGAPDIDYNPVIAAGATGIIVATEVGLDGVEPDAMFGSRVTDEINWQGHDPTDLITNLHGVSIYLYTATGLPGPYDKFPPNLEAMGIEAATHASTLGFVTRAQQVGLPVHLDDYVFGTHSWPYWTRDLKEYLVPLMQMFDHPRAAPTTISYESVMSSWSQWGWSVSLKRAVPEQWTTLTAATASGFVLSGVGVASVVTPDFYRPFSTWDVTIGAHSSEVAADSGGHLHLTVPFGGLDPGGALGSLAIIGVPKVPSWGGTVHVTVAPA